MLTTSIKTLLTEAWRKLGLEPVSFSVDPSERPEYGDFSSNIAMAGAKIARSSPRDLAARIIGNLPQDAFAKVEIAGPGFINLHLKREMIHSCLKEILQDEGKLTAEKIGRGTKLQVEFVSSNPTGPLTVGHGRQAVLGDVLSSLYEQLGYDVTREYYFNDEGRQVDLLAQSLWARYRQLCGEDVTIPEQGYQGDYLIEIAQQVKDDIADAYPVFDEAAKGFFRVRGVSVIKEMIKDDLAQLGVKFDNWFSEADLHRRGEVDAALKALTERGGTYKQDGAIWLRAEDNGGIKDSVLIRSDGRPTYLMVDIAYHMDKYRRGFNHVIDVQGADHHVEQSCMQAALKILGYPQDFLRYAVHQFVSIVEGGETLRMSTRAGRFVLLRDLTSELGRDVVRYFMVARKPETHLQFDLDLARAESLDNPVYYIQYAHTRIASIFRKAEEIDDPSEVDLSPLQSPSELDLIKQLDSFPEILEEAALRFAPHLLAEYALNLARAFHAYYADHRVLGEETDLMQARLALLSAVQMVFKNSLEILGMSTPEMM
ncbi:arginine--tRNA ligase [Candidatus Bipolaricaulota bacterium]|nr:arginine--tRNA ligase [Candidatus Bipolaricaulota bacterium]